MSDIEERAAELVNSASGIANDFLNHFNEVLLLIEKVQSSWQRENAGNLSLDRSGFPLAFRIARDCFELDGRRIHRRHF